MTRRALIPFFLLATSVFAPAAAAAVDAPVEATQIADTPRKASVPGFGLRVAAEVGGAVVGALGVGLTTAGIVCGTLGGYACMGSPLYGAIAGAVIGVPLGTWGAGRLLAGEGGFWTTVGGTLLGVGAGFAVALPTIMARSLSVPMYAAGGLMVLGGAVAAFELSHHFATRESRMVATPLLVPGGGGLVIAGAF